VCEIIPDSMLYKVFLDTRNGLDKSAASLGISALGICMLMWLVRGRYIR